MSTITITGENLIAALAAVTPSAAADDTLPILTCVHFETRDGELFVATTDRYTLATYRVDTTEIDGEISANLQGRDVKDLVAFARKAKRVPLTLEFSEASLAVSDYERNATYRLLFEAEFPKVWAILPERQDLVFGVNREFIGRFAKAADTKDPAPLIMSPHGLKPIRVEVGERFVGAIMPVRLPDVTKGETATYHDGNVTVTKAPEPTPEPEPAEPEAEAPVSSDEPAEDVADDPLAEEEGAETTPDWCESCKGFGVVRGVGAKAGQPYKTANGAATATTSVECPTCHGDKIAAA
jgi:hypothetical protein